MKLYSGPLSMFGAKVEIALREKGVEFELVMVAFAQAQGYSPRHPEVLRVNPKRQVPVLIDGDVEGLSRGGTFQGLHVYTSLQGVAVHINAFNFPVWGMLEKLAPTLLAAPQFASFASKVASSLNFRRM